MGRAGSKGRDGGTPLRVRVLRKVRSLHNLVAIPLLLVVGISSITGILLGWKKNVDVLQPPTRSAPAASLDDWRPLHQLGEVARAALESELGGADPGLLVVDRLDVRPDKGIVKVLFPGAWEVQVEGVSGEVRSVARRHSDWIESIHDGSIISDGFKLLAMNGLGIGLLALSVTGFWMWLGPRRLRRQRRSQTEPRKAA